MEKLERNDSEINLSIQLETAATKTLRIWAYSLGKYLYVFLRLVLTLRQKTYSRVQEGDNFLE